MSRHLHHRRQHEHHHRGHDVRDPSDSDALTNEILSAMQNDASAVATVVSVVYKTASQTFVGSIGGYVTVVASSTPQAPAPSVAQTSQAPPPNTQSQLLPSTTPLPHPASTLSSVAAPETPSASSASLLITTFATSRSTAANAPDSSTLLHSVSTSPVLSIDAAPSSTSVAAGAQSSAKSSSADAGGTASEKSSGGLSGGAKAGVAIGVLLAIGLVLGLLFFFYRQRRISGKTAEDSVKNEKNPFGDNQAISTTVAPASAPAPIPQTAPSRVSTPPQLSLRPASQFQPELLGRGGKAADILGITGSAVAAATIAQRNNQLSNPFEDRAAVDQYVAPSVPAGPLSSNSSKPIVDELPAPLRIRTPSPESETGVVTGAAIAQRHNAPKPLDIKRTASPAPSGSVAPLDAAVPSPAATEFSITSVSATSITSGPGAMNVHRIQLDFKPSMDDELELRAGQLVRLLHEYDDGWALCIRLDRSQQGVAPRTCLSTRPVKPRARGPPRNGTSEGPRFVGAAAQHSRPSSPLAERSARAAAPMSSAAPPNLNVKIVQQPSAGPDTTTTAVVSPLSPAVEVPALQPSVQRKPVGNQSP